MYAIFQLATFTFTIELTFLFKFVMAYHYSIFQFIPIYLNQPAKGNINNYMYRRS